MKILRHGEDHNPYGLSTIYGTPYTLEETKTLFRAFKVTEEELADLNEWVKEGHSFYGNPWLISDDKGNTVNFIDGSRCVKEMYEDYQRQMLMPASPITDMSFIYDDLPF